jgi:outer membrane murein-binding lipoprotein Lpp
VDARVPGTEITPQETRRLSTGLIVYGAVGVLLSIAALVAVFWLNSQFGDVQDDLAVQVDQLEQTLQSTSESIDAAADSADGFSGTLDSSVPGLESAAAVLERVENVLTGLRIPFLGDQLQSVRDLGAELGTLSDSLSDVAATLEPNSAQLAETTEAMRALASDIDDLRASLEDGLVERGADQGFNFLRAGIIALTIWLALPSLAALLAGLWLRRAVSPRPAAAGPTA